jgi:hypothetical protein
MGRSFTPVDGGVTPFEGQELLSAFVVPPLQSSVNDYQVAARRFANASLLQLSATTAVNITGLQGATPNRQLTLMNTGAAVITLKDTSGASLPVNQFHFGGTDVILNQNQGVTLSALLAGGWAAVGSAPGASGATAAATYVTATNESAPLPNSVIWQFNITPDSHAVTPANVANDEFESGASIDLTGARFAGATPWTWLNQLNATAPVAQGAVVLNGGNVATDSINAVLQPVAGSTWTYQAKFALNNVAGAAGGAAGLIVQNAANGHLLELGVYNPAVGDVEASLIVKRYTNPTTVSASEITTGPLPGNTLQARGASAWVYLQMLFDGVNIDYAVSLTGVPGTYQQVYTETAAAFLGAAPTNVGLMVNSQSATVAAQGIFDWFRKVA